MQYRLRKGYAAVAVMAIAVALLIVSMTSPVASSSADFSIFNSGWNGASDLAVLTYKLGRFAPSFALNSTGTDITVEQMALTDIDLDPQTSALLIIGPAKSFSSSEGEAVADFVRNGGQLLLADDFGTGNSLLENMGASSRFSRDLVMDLAFEKQPEFSVVFDFRDDQVTRNVTTLLLNYPSSLMLNSTTAEALAFSSVASWLDTNGNRLQEWGEPRGPFPIVAREPFGVGSILLLSDPSVLINGMRDYMDNAVFGDSLIDQVCRERTTVYFDESHRDFFDPVAITMEFTGEVSANAKAGFAVIAFVMTLWIATDSVDRSVLWIVRKGRHVLGEIASLLPFGFLKGKEKPRPEPMTAEEMLDRVIKEHPEWRAGLVRYLLRERGRHGKLLEQK